MVELSVRERIQKHRIATQILAQVNIDCNFHSFCLTRGDLAAVPLEFQSKQVQQITTIAKFQLTDTGVHLGSGRTVQLSAVEDLAPKLELVADRNHNSGEPTVWEMTNLNKSATPKSVQVEL